MQDSSSGSPSSAVPFEAASFTDDAVLSRLKSWARDTKGVEGSAFDDAEVEARHIEVVITVKRVAQQISLSTERGRELPTSPTIASEAELSIPAETPFADRSWTFVKEGTLSTRTCGTCSGAGRVTCRRCGGRALVDCRKCAGKGGKPCSPKEPCRTCEGRGWLRDYDDPGSLTNYAMNRRVTCTTCHGSRERDCPRCGGSSWEVCDCSGGKVHCGCGDGFETCNSCDGRPHAHMWDQYTVTHTASDRKFSEAPISVEAGRGLPRGEPARDDWRGQALVCGHAIPDDVLAEALADLLRQDDLCIAVRAEIELLPVARVLWGPLDKRRTAYVCGTDLAVKAPKARQASRYLRDLWVGTPTWQIVLIGTLFLAVAMAAVLTPLL